MGHAQCTEDRFVAEQEQSLLRVNDFNCISVCSRILGSCIHSVINDWNVSQEKINPSLARSSREKMRCAYVGMVKQQRQIRSRHESPEKEVITGSDCNFRRW